MINDTDVLIEAGGGAVLAARRLDPGTSSGQGQAQY
jgi:hypothetical protein